MAESTIESESSYRLPAWNYLFKATFHLLQTPVTRIRKHAEFGYTAFHVRPATGPPSKRDAINDVPKHPLTAFQSNICTRRVIKPFESRALQSHTSCSKIYRPRYPARQARP